jgi:hypothetical protein
MPCRCRVLEGEGLPLESHGHVTEKSGKLEMARKGRQQATWAQSTQADRIRQMDCSDSAHPFGE